MAKQDKQRFTKHYTEN